MDAINLSTSKKQSREKVETPPETDLTSLLDLQDFFSAELVNQGTSCGEIIDHIRGQND